MTLTNWLRSYFCGHSPDVVEDWTPARVKRLERQTLEAAGMAGCHYGWSRTIAAKYKRRSQEREKVTNIRRSA